MAESNDKLTLKGATAFLQSKLASASQPAAGGSTFLGFFGWSPQESLAAATLPPLDLEATDVRFELGRPALEAAIRDRVQAVGQVYQVIEGLRNDLDAFFPSVPEILPAFIDGRLLNPDASPATNVSVRALEPPPTPAGTAPWPQDETRTDDRGAFRLALARRPVPEQGLRLAVAGGNRNGQIAIKRSDLIGSYGHLGVLPLEAPLTPLPGNVIDLLKDVAVPTSEADAAENPQAFAAPVPQLTLGEGECARSFRSNAGVIDTFGYSLLVRLIAPNLSGRRIGNRVAQGDGRFVTLSSATAGIAAYVPAQDIADAMGQLGAWELVQRLPIESPIDVTDFRQAIETAPAFVPKAASLGIGYVVRMHQIWIPTGLSLGDLVYSLPLAPGEQQRIVVSEMRESLGVREAESLTAEEFQRYHEDADASTSATFRSAFNESASGGSRMNSGSSGWSVGGATGAAGVVYGVLMGIGVSGGYSKSGSSGGSSSWQSASRDYVSNATQDFHSNLNRAASARRSASRTAVRLASASESQQLVSKVITNHNHCHALTMQYWQVLRHFGVSTKVDDVQLVCFVPLEVVQFLPSGQPRTLASGAYNRNQLLARYAMLLRYLDAVAPLLRFRADLAHGAALLRSFAANPTMAVQSSTGAAQDVIDVQVSGTFLPFEDVHVTAVSTSGARVGPVRLIGASAAIAGTHVTRAELLQALRARRAGQFETRAAALVLPDHVGRSNLARLEFSRAFRTFSYRLQVPALPSFAEYFAHLAQLDVTLRPDELEREVGAPLVADPVAKIVNVDVLEAYNGPGGTDLMGAIMPVAAKRLAPELRYTDLLKIEALFQHVVSNTVTYSKAVWQSLTPEERAILLERFTIGVPDGGVTDPNDEVPLLDCVANEVIAYFGNCAVMPFFIPLRAEERAQFSTRELQEALLRFHRDSFVPAQSSITLPARGVLGEAILGDCNACEKIDLTRFWNWQDSPGDSATDPAQLAALVGGGNQLVGAGGAQAPAGLTAGPMVTINQGPTAMSPSELARALIDKLPSSNLPQNLTGLSELAGQMKVQTETTAESLNKAISEASSLAKTAMEQLPKAIEAKNKGSEAKPPKDKDDKGDKGDKGDKDEEGDEGVGGNVGGSGGETDPPVDGGPAPTE